MQRLIEGFVGAILRGFRSTSRKETNLHFYSLKLRIQYLQLFQLSDVLRVRTGAHEAQE